MRAHRPTLKSARAQVESLRQLHALLDSFARCKPGAVARSAMKLMIAQGSGQPGAQLGGLQPSMLRQALGLPPLPAPVPLSVQTFLGRALTVVRGTACGKLHAPETFCSAAEVHPACCTRIVACPLSLASMTHVASADTVNEPCTAHECLGHVGGGQPARQVPEPSAQESALQAPSRGLEPAVHRGPRGRPGSPAGGCCKAGGHRCGPARALTAAAGQAGSSPD